MRRGVCSVSICIARVAIPAVMVRLRERRQLSTVPFVVIVAVVDNVSVIDGACVKAWR